ncbi:MAG TPA: hypothetical protein VKB59_09240 [Micromonosporaceae bacterium]|nr:hypothetical protein [Micromonosporaceae bacterium]
MTGIVAGRPETGEGIVTVARIHPVVLVWHRGLAERRAPLTVPGQA